MEKHQLGQTPSRTHANLHIETSSGTNIKWEKHQVGQTTCQQMGVGQILSGTNIEWDKN